MDDVLGNEESSNDVQLDVQPMEIDSEEIPENNPETIEEISNRVLSVFSKLTKMKEEKSLDTKAWIEVNKILQKDNSQFSVNRSGPLFDFKQYLEKPHIIEELDTFLKKNEERQTYLKSLSVPHFKQPAHVQQISSSAQNTQESRGTLDYKNEKKMLFRLDMDISETVAPTQSSKTENEYHAYLLKKIKKCGNQSVIHYKLKSATSYNPSGTGTFTVPVQDDELDGELDGGENDRNEVEEEEDISSLEEYTDDIEASISDEEVEEDEIEESVDPSNEDLGEDDEEE